MQQDIDDFSLDFSVMGVGANYRILDSKSLAGLVKWRGISAGTGFYVQSNKLDFEIERDAITSAFPFRQNVIAAAPAGQEAAYGAALDSLGFDADNPDVNIGLTPKFNMGLDVTTMTVPLEASTAVSLLFGALNVSVGAGVDLNFGKSEIVLKGDAKAVTRVAGRTRASPSRRPTSPSTGAATTGPRSSAPACPRPRAWASAPSRSTSPSSTTSPAEPPSASPSPSSGSLPTVAFPRPACRRRSTRPPARRARQALPIRRQRFTFFS